MLAVLISLIVLASIVLVLVVLVQNSKGGGLSSGFSSSNQIMGVRKTTDFIEKATWGLAAFIIVLSLISGKMIHSEKAVVADTVPDVNLPASPQTTPDVGGSTTATPLEAPAPAPAE